MFFNSYFVSGGTSRVLGRFFEPEFFYRFLRLANVSSPASCAGRDVYLLIHFQLKP